MGKNYAVNNQKWWAGTGAKCNVPLIFVNQVDFDVIQCGTSWDLITLILFGNLIVIIDNLTITSKHTHTHTLAFTLAHMRIVDIKLRIILVIYL